MDVEGDCLKVTSPSECEGACRVLAPAASSASLVRLETESSSAVAL
uniref:Uncharacterized protein n=1 Tax=Peronospora matthiolae TaxID=2874970 RepID=A0AAV1UR29_9STRA